MNAEEVLSFWFEELEKAQWWAKDEALDARIRERFSEVHRTAVACELYPWRENARGRLAEIIVIDQFSRNLYRGQARAFYYDALALALAQEAVGWGCDRKLEARQRAFVYLPFMHSESPAIHRVAVELFSQDGLEENLAFERRHKDIIDRFGRYPHRNHILGRSSTLEELEFLKQPGSSF